MVAPLGSGRGRSCVPPLPSSSNDLVVIGLIIQPCALSAPADLGEPPAPSLVGDLNLPLIGSNEGATLPAVGTQTKVVTVNTTSIPGSDEKGEG